jgi:hypothetical protein
MESVVVNLEKSIIKSYEKKILLGLSLFMITAFTIFNAQTGSIIINSIQSPIEVVS